MQNFKMNVFVNSFQILRITFLESSCKVIINTFKIFSNVYDGDFLRTLLAIQTSTAKHVWWFLYLQTKITKVTKITGKKIVFFQQMYFSLAQIEYAL